jgi:hypothetical protein
VQCTVRFASDMTFHRSWEKERSQCKPKPMLVVLQVWVRKGHKHRASAQEILSQGRVKHHASVAGVEHTVADGSSRRRLLGAAHGSSSFKMQGK